MKLLTWTLLETSTVRHMPSRRLNLKRDSAEVYYDYIMKMLASQCTPRRAKTNCYVKEAPLYAEKLPEGISLLSILPLRLRAVFCFDETIAE